MVIPSWDDTTHLHQVFLLWVRYVFSTNFQLTENCLTTVWQMSDNRLTTVWQLSNNWLTTVWQLSDNCITPRQCSPSFELPNLTKDKKKLTKLGLVPSRGGLHKLQWIKYDWNCILKNFVDNNLIYGDPLLRWHCPLESQRLALRSICLLHYLATVLKLSDDCLITVWQLHHPTPMFP